mmetsp:Transcript_156455/g.272217  ORF Transcript_156455/g.272217 Transcript_156455/m.272217 type:complete len:219 (+) Transcript_156455:108-764(+)
MMRCAPAVTSGCTRRTVRRCTFQHASPVTVTGLGRVEKRAKGIRSRWRSSWRHGQVPVITSTNGSASVATTAVATVHTTAIVGSWASTAAFILLRRRWSAITAAILKALAIAGRSAPIVGRRAWPSVATTLEKSRVSPWRASAGKGVVPSRIRKPLLLVLLLEPNVVHFMLNDLRTFIDNVVSFLGPFDHLITGYFISVVEIHVLEDLVGHFREKQRP